VIAITPQAQPTTPGVSPATIREVLARGIQAHPELAVRMDRAATIVETRRIEPGRAAGWWVQSESRDTEHFVTQSPRGYRLDQCTCEDFRQRGGPCKHAIAVRLLQACQRQEARIRAAIERHVDPAPACGPQDGEPRYTVTPQGTAYLAGLRDEQAGSPWAFQAEPTLRAAYEHGRQDGALAADQPPQDAA
jgi:hypothetical protein